MVKGVDFDMMNVVIVFVSGGSWIKWFCIILYCSFCDFILFFNFWNFGDIKEVVCVGFVLELVIFRRFYGFC